MAESGENRKAQAMTGAEACVRLLTEQFGARRVILFGSLAGKRVWHGQSDIDLAVEGLAPSEFFRAYSACRDLLPRDLDLDLVPLEKACPEMRARILEEVVIPDDPFLAVQAVIEDELTALGRVTQEMEDLLAGCAQPPTRTELRAMAGIMHEFYNGAERIFERISVGLGEGVPQGSYWHADLLVRMATPQEEIRPAIIDDPLHARLKEYLDFRHFFRHAYGYTLEWNQLRWKAENLLGTLTALRNQLQHFWETWRQ